MKVTDQALIDIIRDLVAEAKDEAELGLMLGKLVVPTISLNSAALQFTIYRYTGSLANTAQYTPPDGTIVFTAAIEFTVIAENDWTFHDPTLATHTKLADSFLQAETELKNVMSGVFICDGVRGFMQNTGAARDILLLGVSMA